MIPTSKIYLAASTLGMAAALLGCAPAARARGDEEAAPVARALGIEAPKLELAAAASEASAPPTSGAAPGTKPLASAPRDELTLIAGGDVCFGRELGQVLLQTPGYDPFAAVGPLFASADVRFVNLESQLSDQGGETQSKHHPLVFTGPPAGADALARAGVQIVSAANNHMWDYGERAFFETLANLKRVGVAHPGAGRNHKQTYSPVTLTVDGFRIAFLAVTDIWNQGSLARHPARPYVANADLNALVVTVRKLKADQMADAVVVSYHGGVEYSDQPLADTRSLANLVIDAGADAFLGHHPHVLQGIELRHGKAIFYSLGNFLMNVNAEYPETGLGMLARVRLRRGELPSYEVCPIRSGGLFAVPLPADPEREATVAAFSERIRRASARSSHAPELGAFGPDGCARILPGERKARAASSRTGSERKREGR